MQNNKLNLLLVTTQGKKQKPVTDNKLIKKVREEVVFFVRKGKTIASWRVEFLAYTPCGNLDQGVRQKVAFCRREEKKRRERRAAVAERNK